MYDRCTIDVRWPDLEEGFQALSHDSMGDMTQRTDVSPWGGDQGRGMADNPWALSPVVNHLLAISLMHAEP